MFLQLNIFVCCFFVILIFTLRTILPTHSLELFVFCFDVFRFLFYFFLFSFNLLQFVNFGLPKIVSSCFGIFFFISFFFLHLIIKFSSFFYILDFRFRFFFYFEFLFYFFLTCLQNWCLFLVSFLFCCCCFYSHLYFLFSFLGKFRLFAFSFHSWIE